MPTIVYRSLNPAAAIAAIEGHTAAMDEWREKLRAFQAEFSADGERHLGGSSFPGMSTLVTGLSHERGMPIPEGWRLASRRRDLIVPDKRTRTGKELAKRLSRLRSPAPLHHDGLPVTAEYSIEFGRLMLVATRTRVVGDDVFAYWEDVPADLDLSKVDPQLWEPVRLSVYYAAVESVETTSGATA